MSLTDFTLPLFGQLDLSNLDEYYDVAIDFNGTQVTLDLNFDEHSVEPAQLEAARTIINNLVEQDRKNWKYIEDDFKNGETVRRYIQHHLEGSEEELTGLVDFEDRSTDPAIQLLQKLRLKRVGFYPEDEQNYVIFDYSIAPDLTDYLLVLFCDVKGDLKILTIES